MFEHEHPLNLTDLWSEEENEDYEEDKEENEDEVDAKQDFRCLCSRCHEEINWFHRYYYSCSTCSDFSIHKFCAELPERLEDICEAGHTLGFCLLNREWRCDICRRFRKPRELLYRCDICYFKVDANCATKALQKNIIHHPSHRHPLVRIPRQILDKCDACGKEHKGIFYHCPTCASSYFIHSDCAFLPRKMQIQHTTNDIYSHIHPLTLAYSFPYKDIRSKKYPRCRVCRRGFDDSSHLWLYKCEKCRYYTHLDCATSRKEPFMSILTSPGTGKLIKNYDDVEHPDLLHLPFPDPSYSLLKHLFFKESGSKTHEVSHQHPLILEDSPTSSRISYHDPTKRIETLCNGCLRPITSGPVYVCSNEEEEHCNFVLHEWCSRLPIELKDNPHHPQHPLILHSKIIGKFFGVFACDLCRLYCNGFAYCCVECDYYIDVNCAFVPKEITHKSHPNHLLTLNSSRRSFICHTCDYFRISLRAALLIPETTTHKCDKHPMKLSYFPIENHMGDYFCEICEEEFDPESTFYHCRECMQSMHTACAPSILRYETYAKYDRYYGDVHRYVNVKFGGTYNNIEVHPHPLSFVQGVESDGRCHKDGCSLHFDMIFKCLTCEFAISYDCMKRLCEEKN
ncbi:putative chromatin regulator PHD family [Helianthus annuus]|nr:putative chromatin regulator PHD family [Helianthus annuus]